MTPGSRPVAAALAAAMTFALGACATGSAGGSRTIDVTMDDDMRYAPDSFEFEVGDVVTFELRNEGELVHEMFIGDRAAHEAHEAEMREDPHSDAHGDPAAISVEPGATASLTYTFESAGELLAGCHEPGHYEAGMVASITVRP